MALLRTLALVSALGPGNPTADCEGVPATKAARAVANDNRVASATDTARGSGRFRPDLGATDDGQLVGALIVDPEGRSPAIASSSSPTPASYRILARGMASAYDSVLSASRQETVVSGFMAPNRTMTMEWVPEKPGNWLFHSHFLVHMSAAQRVDRVFGPATAESSAAHSDHGVDAMAGPIVGIAVRPASGRDAPASTPPRRVLRLFANERPGVFGERPGMGFVLQSGDTHPPPIPSASRGRR